MKKSKIAIICPKLGVCNRGAETFTKELALYLQNHYDVKIFSCATAKGFESQTILIRDYHGILWNRYSKLVSNSKLFRYVLNRTRLTQKLIPERIYNYKIMKYLEKDKLVDSSFAMIFPKNGLAGAKLAHKIRRKFGTPFIFNTGGGIGEEAKKVLEMKPDCFIALTSYAARWSCMYYANVVTIPNGVNVPELRDKEKKNKNRKLILSVGHLDLDFKRHQLTIEAISLLTEEYYLLILGAGDKKEYFEELANRKIKGRCEIKSVKYNEIMDYYQKADVFVLPSKEEPFGIVYIEAMSANLPIVATLDESRKEIIGDAGILCNVENAVEYATAIKCATEWDWGYKPYEKALTYDWSVIGEKYKSVIDKLVK